MVDNICVKTLADLINEAHIVVPKIQCEELADNKKALIDRNSIVPTGPTITENEGQKAQNRTYQDLIKNPDDANSKSSTRTKT